MANVKILEQKQAVIDEITEKVKDSATVVFFEYRGLTVGEMTELRRNLRETGSDVKVYKNTLVKRAADELNLDLDTYLEGPNAILFGEKLLEPIKVLSNFGKDHNNVNIISGVIDGKVVEPSVINEYASIPSMEGLLTMLAGGMIEHVKNLSIALNLYAEAKEEK